MSDSNLDPFATPTRPRRRVRWFVLGFMLLILSFPASEGPAVYARIRGWLPFPLFNNIYGTLERLASHSRNIQLLHWRYVGWWEELGVSHTPETVTIVGDANGLHTITHSSPDRGETVSVALLPTTSTTVLLADGKQSKYATKDRQLRFSKGRLTLDGAELARLPTGWKRAVIRSHNGRVSVRSE